ncbi:MAG TPA: SRPBCC domain-containing protein [Microscillaceae bacterium]|nr:SRPBCC domain-containing protein [Microscillaceae bacterium]
MKSIITEIIINAPAENVWNILMNFDQHAEWNPFIKKLTGEAKVGQQLSVEIHPPNQKPSTFTPKVITVKPQQHLAWRGTFLASFVMAGEHNYEIEILGPNKVKFKHYEHFTGILAGVIMKKIGESTKQGFQAMNEALKAKAEAMVKV